MNAFQDKLHVKSIYSDSAPELVSVAGKLGWVCDASTPGVPRNNSAAESKAKLVLNGARCLLFQAGLPSKFWPFAAQAFYNGMNLVLNKDKSRYHKRHGVEIHGKLILFGCLIYYYPAKRTYAKGKARSPKDPGGAAEG